MTHLTRTALVVASFGLLTVGGVVADDADDVVTAAQDLLDTYNAGDTKKMSSFYVDGATGFSGNGREISPFDAGKLAEAIEAGRSYDLAWQDLTARVHGSSAVTSGLLFGTIHLADGRDIFTPWRNSISWVKEGGKWKVTQAHTSDLKPDVVGAQGVISRYHQAFVDNDGDAARACLTDFYVRSIKGLEGEPGRWGGSVADAAMIDEWVESFSTDDVTYENSVQFLQTEVNEQSGVVVTSETGSNSTPEGSGSWEGVSNLWWVVKVDGEWKIAGSAHNIGE
ncbi:MAG TPA: nuclear transport factor 2 family protein [Candidatus Latescibacteria bacterium]|nr:nuclear transport factor 2 family protein [Candidatus Latescibacterota bacterium]